MAGITTALVNPPISGAVYVNPTAHDIWAHLQFSLNPTAGAAASIIGEISPDGVVFTPLARFTVPAGFTAIDGDFQMCSMMVPAGYFYRYTTVNTVMSSLIGVTGT